MKGIKAPSVAGLLFVVFCFTYGFANQATKKPTRSVTGTYKYVLNTLEVLELPDHKVRISFAGYYPNDRRKAETRNVGSFDETVPLKGRTARVKIQFGDEPCLVTISFRGN